VWSNIPAALLGVSPKLLVSIGRLALAAFSLTAISAQPVEAIENIGATNAILIAYAVYAAVLFLMSVTVGIAAPIAVAAHAVDLIAFVALIHYTDGPTSPFFLFLTFAIFSAALQWSWRGALGTTALTAALYIVASYFGLGPIRDINRLVIRWVDLVLAGAFLTYLTARLADANLRLGRLADWPAPSRGPTGVRSSVDRALKHAAEALGWSRASVRWESSDEPFAQQATYDRPDASERQHQDEKVSPIERRAESQAGGQAASPGLSVAISGADFVGSVDFRGGTPTAEARSLAEIAARQIGGEIERLMLQEQLIAAAASRERERFAEDIHDDLLQSLAAIALQLKALEGLVSDDVRDRMTGIGVVIESQQTRLRHLAARLRDSGSAARNNAPSGFDVERELRLLLAILEQQWSCHIVMAIEPEGAGVPDSMGPGITFVITEAVANAVRHGRARNVNISVAIEPGQVSMTIRDDGAGLPAAPVDGANDERSGSASLRRRVSGLGGRMRLTDMPNGVAIEIHLPIKHPAQPAVELLGQQR
jgi:signal transduction histidine kinase